MRGASGRCRATAATVALLVGACSVASNPTAPPDPGSGSGEVTIPFSVGQLRSGDFEGILHCAGPLHVPQEYEEYVAAFAQTPPVSYVLYYSLLDSRFTPVEKQAVLKGLLASYVGIPFLGLSYTSSNPDGSSTGHDDEVAAGQFDAEIRQIAAILADEDRPVFFRPGFEFNGVWNSYSPESYGPAFRRIHDLFLEEGAQDVIFVWNYHPAGNVAPYMAFYPGDASVDWWGVNLFGKAFEAPQAGKVQAFIADARARGKPVMIPESIPHKFFDMQSLETWDEWFAPYFGLIADDVKAFCYSNRDYTKIPAWSDWGDLRIEKSVLKPLWAVEIARPQYVHLP